MTYDILHVVGLYYLSIKGNPEMRETTPTTSGVSFTNQATFYPNQFHCFSRDMGFQFLYDPEYANFSGCLCNPQFYGEPGDGCLGCLPHGQCSGGEFIDWDRGFYPVFNASIFSPNATSSSSDMLGLVPCANPKDRCNPDKNCAFTPSTGVNCTTTCKPGYTGYRCAGCQEQFFKRGGACFKCSSQSAHWLIISAAAWGVLLLAGVAGGLMNALGYLENLLKLIILLSIVFSVRLNAIDRVLAIATSAAHTHIMSVRRLRPSCCCGC